MNFSQLDLGVFLLKIYGISLSLAFFVATLSFYQIIKKENFSKEFFIHHFWRWLIGGILVGRLVTLVLYPDIFERFDFFSFFAFWEGRINFHGAVFGFLLTMYFDCLAAKKNFWKWGDISGSSFLLGMMILDIGAFLTGGIYGTETSLPWGVQYETFGVDIVAPIHPVTLYLLIVHFFLRFWVKRKELKNPYKNGHLFLTTFIFFFFIDFVFQFLRQDQTMYLYGMRIEQYFDLLFVLVGLWFKYGYKKLK